jgi:hypothetical protein
VISRPRRQSLFRIPSFNAERGRTRTSISESVPPLIPPLMRARQAWSIRCRNKVKRKPLKFRGFDKHPLSSTFAVSCSECEEFLQVVEEFRDRWWQVRVFINVLLRCLQGFHA